MLNHDNSNGNNAAAAEDKNHGQSSDEESELKRRFCKICYITSEDELQDGTGAGKDDEWVHPCKCSGTIKWVHRRCLQIWLEQAPYQQRYQCTMCKYNYRSSWQLKPLSRWTWPSLKLNFWDGIEICMDFACTYFMLKRINQLIQGTAKSVYRSYFWIFMYRVLVLNNRRIFYYQNLASRALTSVLETSIQNAE